MSCKAIHPTPFPSILTILKCFCPKVYFFPILKGHTTNLKLLSLSKKLQFDLFFLAAFAAEPADAEISLGAALSLAPLAMAQNLFVYFFLSQYLRRY